METTYFVSFRLFNGENHGWAYNIEKKTTDKGEAMRKFGELVKTYYETKPFVFGYIKVEDQRGNEYDSICWDNTSEGDNNGSN